MLKHIIWAGLCDPHLLLSTWEHETDTVLAIGYSKRVHHKLIKVNFAIGFCITALDVRGEIY